MALLSSLATVIRYAWKRLTAHALTTLATLLGLVIAVALGMTVPLYADAITFRLLEERLGTQAESLRRPPFSYMFNYIGSWYGPREWEEIADADTYLMQTGSFRLGLPRRLAVRHFETDLYRLYPRGTSNYSDEDALLTRLSFGMTSGIENHITLLEGSLPAPARLSGDAIEIMISEVVSEQLGWQVGEEYTAYRPGQDGLGQIFHVRIAAIWKITDPADAYWFYPSYTFDELMLVPESTFAAAIAPAVPDEVNLATWYFIMDGSRVSTRQVAGLVSAATAVEQRLQNLLPNATTLLSPVTGLQTYRVEVARLSTLLYAFNVPTVGLVLVFIGMMGGMSAGQRRHEFAVFRSRGGTIAQVAGIALLEGIILGVVALVLGSGLALLFTQWMGRTRSFLDFSAESGLRFAFERDALWAGAVVIILATLAQLWPAVAAARRSIVSHQQAEARVLRPPLWQRFGLDFLLLAVAAYGFYQLGGQGGLLVDTADAAGSFQNPLLLLLPTLTILAFSLLFLRLLPIAMRAAGWLLGRTRSFTLLQATRYLARSSSGYSTLLILLVLTVSLAIFTASLARTLDFQLYDQAFYQVGADVNLFTSPNPFGTSPVLGFDSQQEIASYTFVPLSEYEEMDGVVSATRVGKYRVTAQIGTSNVYGDFLGVDWREFNTAAYWRWDFSDYRIGSLMNALGSFKEGILVPRSLMRSHGLSMGDQVRLTVFLEGTGVEMNAQLVGAFDYFPTWIPEGDEILLVGNLDTLFEQAGGEFPYRVWLDTDGPIDEERFYAGLSERRLLGTIWNEPHSRVARGLVRPERQGLFGLLSIGFVASALLTILGMFLYGLFSYRMRAVELGVLRAIGLSRFQVTRLVAWELALFVFSGLSLGTALGVGISLQYVPSLQLGVQPQDLVPPFLVEIGWQAVSNIYLLFGGLFFVALFSLVFAALRMRIFMAIKLGETA